LTAIAEQMQEIVQAIDCGSVDNATIFYAIYGIKNEIEKLNN